MLWLWFNPVKVSFLVLLCIAWPILICLSKKGEKFTNVALGNSQPFCPPCRHPFFSIFFTIQSFILFIHPLFFCFQLQTERIQSSFRDSKPRNRIWLLLHRSTLVSALIFCLSSLHSDFTSMYFFSFFCSSALLFWLLKAQMGWNESFSLWCRLGLWVEKPSEALPKAKETLSNN